MPGTSHNHGMYCSRPRTLSSMSEQRPLWLDRARSYEVGTNYPNQHPQPPSWGPIGSYSAPGSLSMYSPSENSWTGPMDDSWTAASDSRPYGHYDIPVRSTSQTVNPGLMSEQVAYEWTHIPQSPMTSPSSTLPLAGATAIDRPPVLGVDIQVQDVESTLRRLCNMPPNIPLDFSAGDLSLPRPTGPNQYTWMRLIQICLWSSPDRQLTLDQLYTQFEKRFSDVLRDSPDLLRKVKGNIRHELSYRKTFTLGERLGGRHYWTLDYRYLSGEAKRERKRGPKSRKSPSPGRRGSYEDAMEESEYEALVDPSYRTSGPSRMQPFPAVGSSSSPQSPYSSSIRLSHPTYHHNLSSSPERMDISDEQQLYSQFWHPQPEFYMQGSQGYENPRSSSQ